MKSQQNQGRWAERRLQTGRGFKIGAVQSWDVTDWEKRGSGETNEFQRRTNHIIS